MARRRGRNRVRRAFGRVRRFRRGKSPMSILKVAAGITPIALGVKKGLDNAGGDWNTVASNPVTMLDGVLYETTGYSISMGKWEPAPLVRNISMMVGAWAGSKIADYTGANRAIKRVPMIGKYIKL